MAEQCESGGFGRRCQPFTELTFDRFGDVDIDDLTARHTHQVMMVAFQILGQFESGTLSVGENLHHHTGFLENRKIAIHTALRQIPGGGRDLSGHERVLGRRKDFHQATATIRVSLIDGLQASRGDVVNIGSVLGLAHTKNVQATRFGRCLARCTYVLEDGDPALNDGRHERDFV